MSRLTSERAWIIALLRDDLYERVADAGPETMAWESPTGWRVLISGSWDEPIVEIHRPDGALFWGPAPCSRGLLDEVLP